MCIIEIGLSSSLIEVERSIEYFHAQFMTKTSKKTRFELSYLYQKKEKENRSSIVVLANQCASLQYSLLVRTSAD